MKHNDLEINRLIERLETLGILVQNIESSGFGNMLNFELTYQIPEQNISKTISFRRFDIQDVYLHFKDLVTEKGKIIFIE
jgi:molybdenum cofactor biosynthesis enzyme MoaA